MLYQIGPLSLDTRPFSAEKVSRSGGADLAAKPVMGALQPREFMGEGDETLTLSGQILPFKIGGLSELEMAFAMSRSGQPVPVVRGDGKALGWFAIESVSEDHAEIRRNGVGFVVRYTLSLVKVPAGMADAAGAAGANGIIGQLLSLFEAL